MGKGLKTLQTAYRTALRREAHANLSHDFDSDDISDSCISLSRRKRSQSHQDEEDGFNDSAIGPEDHPFVKSNASGSSRDDHQQAPYSAGGIFYPSPSTTPSFSINSNAYSLLAGPTPTVTAAPQFPYIQQQPQTLPSFSVAFGMPSISAALHRSPYNSPALTAGRAASRSEARVNLNPGFNTDEISEGRFLSSPRERSQSYEDEEVGFNDSAIGTETPLVNHRSFGSGKPTAASAPQ